jgi:hypothetical protein
MEMEMLAPPRRENEKKERIRSASGADQRAGMIRGLKHVSIRMEAKAKAPISAVIVS